MTDNIWDSVVEQLKDSNLINSIKKRNDITIDKLEYEVFCKEFVFNKLQGETFAIAFCKKFNIQDSALSVIKNDAFAKELIESLGYIK